MAYIVKGFLSDGYRLGFYSQLWSVDRYYSTPDYPSILEFVRVITH